MKILHMLVLRGPNRWSNYRRKLIEVKLDLEELEQFPTNKIEGFAERLEKLLPSMHLHECSENRPGGFFSRVRGGTWMGHVIEHIALELQSLAGMECGYGRTRTAGSQGVYYVVFSYQISAAGLQAARQAVSMAEALVKGEDFNVAGAVEELRDIWSHQGFSDVSIALQNKAGRRNIPVQARDENDVLIFGQGRKARMIPLKEGHPHFPSLPGTVLLKNLSENGIPAEKEPEALERNGYGFFILNGRLLAAVEYHDGESLIVYLDKVQLESRIHPANIFLVERVAKLCGMNQCTVQFTSPDITLPYSFNNSRVTGVMAGPPRDWPEAAVMLIASRIIDDLFPPGENGRIPVVAVTGTNGKTTTSRLIAHMASTAGNHVGFINTDGIYVDDIRISKGDCSGPSSASLILRDPTVDFAVLECARGGIIRSGLGFDKCDVSIVTNITGDHLGLDGIYTNEQLAKVKGVVPRSTLDEGFAVLNTEDDLVYHLKHDLDCNLALFGMQMNERLRRHMHLGGLVAYIDDGYFVVCWHGCRSEVARVVDTPLTHQGRSECMIRNILPCLCVAMIRNFGIASIREALETFVPGPRYTPGRMNLFSFSQFDVMVDYAHNPDGFREMMKFLRKTEASKKIGIVGCPGDRLEKDLRSMGYMAARMFDEIIIRHDQDGRGRTPAELTQLIMEGITAAEKEVKVTVISDEREALRYAMSNAHSGSFIVTCTEDVEASISFLQQELNKEKTVPVRYPVSG